MICRILLLLILTSCVSGSFVVNVTQTSYQAEENHNITLEWTSTTNPDRSIKTLKTLDHVHEGVELSESQNKKFSGQVQSNKDTFTGQIRRGRTDNSHLYPCVLNTDDFGRYELSGSAGSFVVNVTQTSYQAEENHNITLEWMFTTKPDRSPKIHIVYCYLITAQKLPVLYHVQEGVEVSECQDTKFSGRVHSDKDALREGRIRLQLSRLRTDDSGRYVCKVITDDGYGSANCQLNVTAAFHQQPDLQAPTGSPKPESKKRSWDVTLAVGLLFLVVCALLYVIRKKGNPDRPSEIPLTEQLPNNRCYNSISAGLENQPTDVSTSV